jgi:MFS family permease
MTVAALVGRFPMAMVGLAVTLLVVAETSSYAAAGAVAASITLAGAAGGPLGARLADRFGQHRVVPPLLAIHIPALAGLTVAVLAGTPAWSWLLFGALAGLTGPNLGAMVRSRWADIASTPRELGSAFALESTLDEVAFVLGPPLATTLAVLVAPWSAMAAGMVLAGSGGLWLAAQRRTEPDPVSRAGQGEARIWRAGSLQVLTLLMLLMGGIFGALEVATVAFAEERGFVGAAGWLLGIFALASGLTGLALGARPGTWKLSNQLLVGSGALALATAGLPFIDGFGGYALGMFAAGLGVSAVLIAATQIIERSMPRARLTESLAVSISGLLVGSALAIALAGARIDAADSSAGVVVGSAAALVSVIVVLLARPLLLRWEAVAHPATEPEAAGRVRSAGGTGPPG